MKAAVAIKRLAKVEELRLWRQEIAQASELRATPLLGFVPTMGALHDGHMALVQRALSECKNVIVSIFVNPLQFGANEDLDKYPRTLQSDVDKLQEAGAHAVFHPAVEEMYGPGETTRVVPPAELTDRLCGLFRPGHFAGVATVVTKLFGQVCPDVAYFGEKDFQQLAVIKRIVADLDIPVKVVGVPTVRESDGLAMSSRNVYLNKEQRQIAPELHRSLSLIAENIRSKRVSVSKALQEARKRIGELPGVALQYLEVCNPHSLQPTEDATNTLVVLVAAKFGDVRLIDNLSF